MQEQKVGGAGQTLGQAALQHRGDKLEVGRAGEEMTFNARVRFGVCFYSHGWGQCHVLDSQPWVWPGKGNCKPLLPFPSQPNLASIWPGWAAIWLLLRVSRRA